MKNIFIVAVLLSASITSANALDLPSHFDEVTALFETAIPAQIGEMTGAFSGRCYFKYDPSYVGPALLFSRLTHIGQNEGPLFPGDDIVKTALIFSDTSVIPEKFDNIYAGFNKAGKIELSSILKKTLSENSVPLEKDGSLQIETQKLQIRKSRNYFVTNQLNDMYCYFFKKIDYDFDALLNRY